MASAAPATMPHQGLVKGRLMRGDSRPASGVLVAVYAQPVESLMHHFAEGDSGHLTMIAQVRTDKFGRYAVAVQRAKLDPFRGPGGNVNMHLFAQDAPERVASISFGLAPLASPSTDKGTTSALGNAGAGRLVPVEVSDLVLARPTNNPKNQSIATSAGREGAPGTGDPATQGGDPGSYERIESVRAIDPRNAFVDGAGASANLASPTIVVCSWILLSNLGPRSVWVGGTYVKATGVSADLQYSNGASRK